MRTSHLIVRLIIGAVFAQALWHLCLPLKVSAQIQQGAILDVSGRPVEPFKIANGKIAVLLFIRSDCPISNRYAPVIQQLSDKYKSHAVFFLVYPIQSETPEQIQKHLREFKYHVRAVRDPGFVLVRESKVSVTPEAAVFTADRRLIYHGRIDDWYQDFGRARQVPTTHELSDAIDAAIAGKAPAVGSMSAVGCYLPEKP